MASPIIQKQFSYCEDFTCRGQPGISAIFQLPSAVESIKNSILNFKISRSIIDLVKVITKIVKFPLLILGSLGAVSIFTLSLGIVTIPSILPLVIIATGIISTLYVLCEIIETSIGLSLAKKFEHQTSIDKTLKEIEKAETEQQKCAILHIKLATLLNHSEIQLRRAIGNNAAEFCSKLKQPMLQLKDQKINNIQEFNKKALEILHIMDRQNKKIQSVFLVSIAIIAVSLISSSVIFLTGGVGILSFLSIITVVSNTITLFHYGLKKCCIGHATTSNNRHNFNLRLLIPKSITKQIPHNSWKDAQEKWKQTLWKIANTIFFQQFEKIENAVIKFNNSVRKSLSALRTGGKPIAPDTYPPKLLFTDTQKK